MKFLKDFSRRFFKSRLVISSLVMGTGAVVGGFINYLYHLLMGRMLGPADYGLLVSLISLFSLLIIPSSAIGLIIVKFVSFYKGKKEFAAISILFKKIIKKLLPFSLLFLLIFLMISPIIISFLHLSSFLPLLIILITILIAIFSMVNKAFLQGLLRFGWLTASGILEVLIKLSVAVIFVMWGFKVNGALFGLVLGGIIALLFTFLPLRSLLKIKKEDLKINTKEILNFSVPAFLFTLSFTSLYTSDVILVRHFFSDQQTGFYAALSTLGKIIFFLAGPIVSVMFPMISERHANGGKYKNLLLLSLGLVGIICLFAISFYFLLPSFIIRIFYGQQYLSVAPFLGFFAVFLSLYTLCFLFVSFFLSIHKTKVVILPVTATILQIVFIYFFHQTILTVVLISIYITALLLISLLLYLTQYKNEK